MKKGLVVFVLTLLVVGCISWQRTLAQSPDEEYFEQTGHIVSGEFLAAYHSVPNPLVLYGYPITNAFEDSTNSRLVQYFQKARFELFEDAPPGQRVQLTPLGSYSHQTLPLLDVPENSPACRKIAPTDYNVCYAFLTFYDQNGGEAQFGLPIANLELKNGFMVQYFQKALFEWHQDRPPGQRVVLADLGSQYFLSHGENPARLAPSPGSDIIKGVIGLKVHAFPGRAVTGMQGVQTIHVIVQDQRLLPVANATVIAIVRLPSGEVRSITKIPPTNAQGITQATFPFSSEKIGVAEVLVIARQNNLEARTITSFRIWW
jgi:hypothetical protein